jgi:peptide/nickel transport system permease protein
MTGSPQGEAYLDIVWKQFRKNRIALAMVWVVLALFAVAIFAPVIASNQPYWFIDGDGIHFPWIVSLLNPDTAIDFIFNVALLIFFPWAIGSMIYNRQARRVRLPGRKRVAVMTLVFFYFLTLTSLLLLATSGSLNPWARWLTRVLVIIVACLGIMMRDRRPGTNRVADAKRRSFVAFPIAAFLLAAISLVMLGTPENKYFARDFKRDQARGKGSGVFTLIPYGPMEQDLDIIFKPPFFKKTGDISRYREGQLHLVGTDDSGRDVLTRLIYGTRISMTIGVVAVSIYVTIGIVIGAIAGYFGGTIDILISRAIEIVMLFPSLFLILTIVALIGPSIYVIMVVIGLTGWPTIARLTRGEFLRQRSIDYVAAARGIGANDSRVIFRHILPNALSPAFVAVPFGIVGAIITEATLSVLGFGVRPPAPSWGSILLIAVSNYEKWWLTVFAGLSIFVTVTVFNVVGNGLRDAMDPKLKGSK